MLLSGLRFSPVTRQYMFISPDLSFWF